MGIHIGAFTRFGPSNYGEMTLQVSLATDSARSVDRLTLGFTSLSPGPGLEISWTRDRSMLRPCHAEHHAA